MHVIAHHLTSPPPKPGHKSAEVNQEKVKPFTRTELEKVRSDHVRRTSQGSEERLLKMEIAQECSDNDILSRVQASRVIFTGQLDAQIARELQYIKEDLADEDIDDEERDQLKGRKRQLRALSTASVEEKAKFFRRESELPVPPKAVLERCRNPVSAPPATPTPARSPEPDATPPPASTTSTTSPDSTSDE